jgi:hypothetical protein
VAAVGNNRVGVAGIAWQAKLMAVKLLDHNGNGDDFAAIRAINWVIAAKQNGVNVRVINASWGGVGKDQLLEDAITNAWNNGILFVTAAGNESTDNDASPSTYQDPCGAPQAVCVAANDQQGRLAGFSNFGVNTVALAAPGVNIASTWPTGMQPSGGYAELQGTSMATPHVTGAAALVTVALPGLSVSALRNRIVTSVDKSNFLSGAVKSGGSLNLCKAMPGCGGNAAVPPTAPIDVSATTVKGVAKVTWKPPASNGGAAVSYSVTSTASSGSQPANAPYQQSGLGTSNGRVTFSVTASNTKGSSPPASVVVTMLGGGYVLDGWGGLHGFASTGATPPAPGGGPYWDGWDIARGVTLLPSGTGGYVLDGFGGLHAFAIGAGPAPPPAVGGPYWQGWDIARGVTMLNDGTGGYVIDGYGGLHPFGIGGGQPPATPVGGSYWSGWDIARGVTVAHDGSGGLVADGWGALHGWGTGNSPAPAASGGPYWAGWEVAHGVAL